jgi:hypothetical protein
LSFSTIFLLNFTTVLEVWYFSIEFYNCSGRWVFFYWILQLFWKCGIFLLNFTTVLEVWYFSIEFYNCSGRWVFFYWILQLFWKFGIFLLNFTTVLEVWYFSIEFYNCSGSMVLFVFHFILDINCKNIFLCLFLDQNCSMHFIISHTLYHLVIFQ